MREGLLIVIATLATCSLGNADEPASSPSSETEASLKAIIERLEARINELETQVQQLKYARQQGVIGGGLLDFVEPQRGQRPVHFGNWGTLADREGTTRVDRAGVIRTIYGRPLGHWGVDFTTHDMKLGPNPIR